MTHSNWCLCYDIKPSGKAVFMKMVKVGAILDTHQEAIPKD